MRKIVLNISDSIYEKFRFEAIYEKKSIQHLLQERIMFKPFDKEVEKAYDNWMSQEIAKIIEE